MKRKTIVDEWRGCYPSNWKGIIVPEAMSHPAKYSSKLIRRIYEHMLAEGWVKPGDMVLDPFGGVALGAWDALRLGLHWTGIELEEKFFKLGNENIASFDTQYGGMPHWGSARLLHGDSRFLLSVIGEHVQVSVSSPPYADSDRNYKDGWKRFHDGHTPLHTNNIQREAQYGTTEGQLSAMPAQQFDAAISSPPYAESIQTNDKGSGIDYSKSKNGGKGRTVAREAIATGYGKSDGQLGGMKNTGFEASISSPPFLQSEGGTPEPKAGGTIDKALYARHSAGNAKANGYGSSDGQLSSMRDGGFAGAVSSPPYGVEALGHSGKPTEIDKAKKLHTRIAGASYGETSGQLGEMPADEFAAAVSSPPYEGAIANRQHEGDPKKYYERQKRYNESHPEHKRPSPDSMWYGGTEGQLAAEYGDDFWLAARAIVEQVYQALAPGGHAVWVVKDYVKNKQIVPFSNQWHLLCEAVGFQTLHEHHAMLIHHKGTQHTLDGGKVEKITESKSFFRRLAEKKGSPRIDFETVFCMVKPDTQYPGSEAQ